MSFDQWMSLVTAVAAAGALYFAWRTVREARDASREQAVDRTAKRLENAIELVVEIRMENDNTRFNVATAKAEQLRAVIAPLGEPLPKTRAACDADFTLDNYQDTTPLLRDATAELREAIGRVGTE